MRKLLLGTVLIETILAIAVFSVLAGVALNSYRVAIQLSTRAAQKEKALYLAEEGIEATRAIRDGSFSYLANGNYGLALVSNAWQFSGTSDYSTDGYQRVVTISTIDTNTKQATSTVSWSYRGATSTVALGTTLTNWRKNVGTMASHVTVNTTGACVYTLDSRYLGGVALTYDGTVGTVTIPQVQTSWTPTTQTLNQILTPYPSTVWTGSSASGVTDTLTTPISFSAAGTQNVDFMWNGSVTGKNFTINFIMSDGSIITATITSPIISICL